MFKKVLNYWLEISLLILFLLSPSVKTFIVLVTYYLVSLFLFDPLVTFPLFLVGVYFGVPYYYTFFFVFLFGTMNYTTFGFPHMLSTELEIINIFVSPIVFILLLKYYYDSRVNFMKLVPSILLYLIGLYVVYLKPFTNILVITYVTTDLILYLTKFLK